MKVMVDRTKLSMGDGERKTQAGGVSRDASFPLGPLSLGLCLLVLLAGCDKKALEQARKEAREAKTAVQQLKHNLGLAEKNIADLRAELNAVRQSRDELQQQIEGMAKERDQTLEYAQKVQETLTAQSAGQSSATAALQKQVKELIAENAALTALVEQLQKGSAAGTPTAVPEGPVAPTDPNHSALPPG